LDLKEENNVRDGEIYSLFNQLKNALESMQVGVSTALTGEAIQNEALKSILIKKELLTEEEWVKTIGEVIQKFNNKTTDQKSELIKPSVDEVAKVEASKDLNEQK
jgi:hypothetical protein